MAEWHKSPRARRAGKYAKAVLTCPKCQGRSHVIRPHESADPHVIHRLRECQSCHARFDTREYIIRN